MNPPPHILHEVATGGCQWACSGTTLYTPRSQCTPSLHMYSVMHTSYWLHWLHWTLRGRLRRQSGMRWDIASIGILSYQSPLLVSLHESLPVHQTHSWPSPGYKVIARCLALTRSEAGCPRVRPRLPLYLPPCPAQVAPVFASRLSHVWPRLPLYLPPCPAQFAPVSAPVYFW